MLVIDPGLRQEVVRWLTELEEKVAADGWGQGHTLWMISTEGTGLVDGEGKPLSNVFLTKIPMPDEAEQSDPNVMLPVLAQMLAEDPQLCGIFTEHADGKLFAIAMATEFWQIPPADAKGAWAGRDWSEHPLRTEHRLVLAADRHGYRYCVDRRHGADDVKASYTPYNSERPIGGGIPELLEPLLVTMLKQEKGS